MVEEMKRKFRYDVGLIKIHEDKSKSEVWWAIDVDLVRANEAAFEMMIMKEKDPNVYSGEIVIRDSQPILPPYRPYHGAKCEEDSSDSSASSDRHLQSVGGDQPRKGECDHCSEPHFTADHDKVWEKREQALEALLKHNKEDWRTEAVGPYVQYNMDHYEDANQSWPTAKQFHRKYIDTGPVSPWKQANESSLDNIDEYGPADGSWPKES